MTKEEAIELLKRIKDYTRITLYSWKEEEKVALEMAIEALENQKTGHWIITGDYYTGAYESIDYVKCSCCNEDSLEKGNYCPNCGAKMKGE